MSCPSTDGMRVPLSNFQYFYNTEFTIIPQKDFNLLIGIFKYILQQVWNALGSKTKSAQETDLVAVFHMLVISVLTKPLPMIHATQAQMCV